MTAEIGLKWLLRLIGISTIPALVAAVMPQSWLIFMLNKAQPGISSGILITYLSRMLMAMYFLIGLQCFVFASDIKRYRPLIWLMSVASIIIASAGLIALFSAVRPEFRVGFFWFVFGDFAEGFAQAFLAVILLLCIPQQASLQE